MTDNQDRVRWTKLVADFEVSDLTQREFATERGISLSNLRYWIYRLRKESRPLTPEPDVRSDQVPERAPRPERSILVPVRVVASAAPKARQQDGAAALLELVLPSGACVRFPAGTDLEYLRKLAASL
jgi:transposase